ncbi:hypothetical protein H6G89_26150 [Oscillatoria sp. FACHB-1407]|uniref:hypothetical protein n=1 Tax=Oscillatoria sp. FACHB-1407 TaxID=2692847 RepID=UPI001682C095|nr:hypothetical protein [Oscillatoria sp. FACHB-1407]MBD2464493.1 hypothetical protein [Oscillatoria sp. FACHB-1407]
MSDDSQRNSAVNATANIKVHHASLENIKNFTPEKVNHFYRGGIREGAGRTQAEMQQLLEKIPPSQRAGVDGESAARNVKEYLANKDASHIQPHSKGGSAHPDNIKWEDKSSNRARGDRSMTKQEQARLEVKAQFDNLTGAMKAGLGAMPKGAAIGAATTIPFALLKNSLRVVRGEITAQQAALETAKETAIGGGIGAVSAFTVTTIAVACPPVAIALTAISPALLVVGGVGMIHQFFQILDDHKTQVRSYYKSLTQDQLQYLSRVEEELIYEHDKTMALLAQAKETSAEIVNRPREAGVEGALKRYTESLKIHQSLVSSFTSECIQASDQILLPSNNKE